VDLAGRLTFRKLEVLWIRKRLGNSNMVRWIPLALLVLLACSGQTNRKSQPAVEIRLANHSDVKIEDIEVGFPSQTEKYVSIPPHGYTKYRHVTKAYSYAYIHAVINGKDAVLQPIDYVGEKLLTPGRYTYVLVYNAKAASKYGCLHLTLDREKE
jgi:hypothetical protein